MSDNNLKVEGSKVPAEKITNPALKEAIEKMQAENSKENVDAMINQVLEAKFILPARVTQIPAARTENGQTMMTNQTQVQFRLLENNRHEKFFGVFTDIEEMYKWKGNEEANKVVTDFDSLAPFAGDNLMKLEAMTQCSLAEALLIPMNGAERSGIAESLIRYIAFHSESPVNIKSLAVLKEVLVLRS